jgi:repressor LexA
MSSYQAQREKVIAFYEQHYRLPGYGELMKISRFKSKNAAYKLISKLAEDDVVVKEANGKLSPGRSLRNRGARLLGLIEAGFPSPAEEELLDVMDFDEYLTPKKESSYILKVKGDSMIDAGIRPGDLVVVERRATYKPGEIVVASIDGEYTMKYLRKSGEAYYLEPANEKFKPIYPKEALSIEAVVTAVVRKY